jgi:hypothetical protein
MSPSFGSMPPSMAFKPLAAGGKPMHPFNATRMTEAETRNVNAHLFGDLSLVEYFSLATTAAHLIRESGLPVVAKKMIITNREHYHPFVAASHHAIPDSSDPEIHAANLKLMDQEQNEVIDASRNGDGEPDSLLMIFTDIPGRDYRIPMAVGLPTQAPPPHAHAIADRIIKLSDLALAGK